MASETVEAGEQASPAYKPKMMLRVSIIGALRNAARELEEVHAERQTRADEEDAAAASEQGLEPDHEDFDAPFHEPDYSSGYAYALTEIADNLEKLDAEPSLLFQFADIYALHGLAAAHFNPASAEAKPAQ